MGWLDILLVRDFCAVRSDFRDSFDVFFLFHAVYAVDWKGRLRDRCIHIYIYIINMERTKSSVLKNNIFYE